MSSAAKNIRFAILGQENSFPAWQAQVIRKLTDHPQIQLELLILEPVSDKLQANSKSSGGLFWRLFHQHYVSKKSKAYKAEDLSDLLAEVPQIQYQWPELEKNLDRIREYQLDFILHFGSATVPGKILPIPKFGVWAFHHGDELSFTGSPACFWEIHRGKLVTGASLQRLAEDPHKRTVLKKGFFKTKIAYAKNIDQAFFGTTNWPVHACVDILNEQLTRLEAAPTESSALVYSAPSNLEMVYFFGSLVRQTFKKAIKSLFYTDFWNIGVAEVPIQRFLEPSPPEVNWFPDLPKSKFIADPFGIKQGDKLHIVYEDFLFKDGVGTIGTIEYNQDGFSEEHIEIDEPFHLSYPFTFELENQIYAIPESYQAKQVRLYKAQDFPHKWVFDRVLINGYAGVDNTLFSHDGYWWMFSTDKDDGVHHNLKIHYTKDFFGQWHPHPKNPVKTDIRSARPAGSIFTHEGNIFRPSMDYSEKIEGRITINKIVTLSTTDFEEETQCIINPFPDTFYSDKVHTLCAAGNYTIVDGAKELFIFNNIHAFRYQLNKQRNKIARRMGFT